MNKLDKQYTDLLQDILDNGVTKQDRTGTGTISVFGRQIRHDMKDGFPLLTTKKMPWKVIVTELLWFLRGDTNIKYLVDNGCNIWNGDAFSNYIKTYKGNYQMGMEEFVETIKTNDEFAKKWGQLGSIYGAQWRSWRVGKGIETTLKTEDGETIYEAGSMYIDQIQNLINDLKTNPDSRRLMVNAWNVGELDQMVLPPCHYGFQVYTRTLSFDERYKLYTGSDKTWEEGGGNSYGKITGLDMMDDDNVPTRAISLMWNQRSVDTFLGLPFNIASYGLLLEIIAKEVNMVPDQLIGNLGDTHLYSNHIDAAKEQIGRELTLEERFKLAGNQYPPGGLPNQAIYFMDEKGIAKRTREPFPLPTLACLDEYWYLNDTDLTFIQKMEKFRPDFFKVDNYQSHPTIKAPLSN
jgi:thymidylate synthase